MLEQLYIDMNTCQPVGVEQMHAIINSTIGLSKQFYHSQNQSKILGSIVSL